jgi:hypothetical protein
LGERLRREGIYSSHLSVWRAQRQREGVAELGPKLLVSALQRRGEQPCGCRRRAAAFLATQ